MSDDNYYRNLLVRYVRHVAMEEGVDFLDTRLGLGSDVEWTDEEWADLQALRKEAR